jgi:heme iron utilization protein
MTPQETDDPAYPARQLWAGGFHAVLSTHSVEQAGFPFGSVVPYVLGRDGHPLLLLSPISQHTRNIEADSRCGLLVSEAGDGDVQTLARLSAMGRLRRLPSDDDADRYFACFPHTRPYRAELGFRFYRFVPVKLHWNGGFATARWLGRDRIIRPNPFSMALETRILDHMNRDHADALRHYLGLPPDTSQDDPVTLVGIDAEGICLRHGDHLYRIASPGPMDSAESARQTLVAMASGPPADDGSTPS